MMKNKNKVASVLLILIVLLTGFLLYRNYPRVNKDSKQVEVEADELAKFSFSPETISTSVGKDFTIDLMIYPAKHAVSNADLVFAYDKTKLKLDNISPSDQFSQVISSNTAIEGFAGYSASAGFENSVSGKATYATLHFHALGKVDSTLITIDKEKSGIYADDAPGINNMGSFDQALIIITE